MFRSSVKPFLFGRVELSEQFGESQKTVKPEMQQSLPFNAGVGRGIGLIRPVAGKREGATGSAADD